MCLCLSVPTARLRCSAPLRSRRISGFRGGIRGVEGRRRAEFGFPGANSRRIPVVSAVAGFCCPRGSIFAFGVPRVSQVWFGQANARDSSRIGGARGGLASICSWIRAGSRWLVGSAGSVRALCYGWCRSPTAFTCPYRLSRSANRALFRTHTAIILSPGARLGAMLGLVEAGLGEIPKSGRVLSLFRNQDRWT
uniref:Uncharacterized protein n=1 Tax=Setaria viridis TaxID=4556 RepID=A0A4V6DAE2_SETVI|nr:hypothetical protein SEVIR_3G405900v2 [Setaria viridis]